MNHATQISGLAVERVFTTESETAHDSVLWETRDALISDKDGAVIFAQKDVRVPATWSQTATNIVASKYFHGEMDSPERENGVDQLVGRVVSTIKEWGEEAGYFSDATSAYVFSEELKWLIFHQHFAFNSPCFFNVGVAPIDPSKPGKSWHWDAATGGIVYRAEGYRKPQCSACFINSVDDSMESILDLAKTEGMLFKWGSGTGTNLSSLRGSMERLSGGGTASGPLSFMRGFDAFAGAIKSGGKTRRAAKMVILNADHPDIMDFIECKTKEEAKARTLIAGGYDGSGPDSEAFSSVFFQNANNSIRVSDEFMRACEEDGDFTTYTVKDHRPVKTYKSREILHKIAQATWLCGDPGMQFDSTINRWHTCKSSGRINASNPCSDYVVFEIMLSCYEIPLSSFDFFDLETT